MNRLRIALALICVLGLASIGCTAKEDVTKQPGFQNTSDPAAVMNTMPTEMKDGTMNTKPEGQ